MSWLSKNYEKAALGGAAVVALGLAFWGYTKVNSVETDFATTPKGSGSNDSAVKDASLVTKASSSLAMPRIWDQAAAGDRAVSLFTGVPLFVGRSDQGKIIDPVTAEPIHPPIPNKWWLQYRLDPGFADSPQRDADGDGFSNLEEFEAKTDPTDATKFPSLINKLKFPKEKTRVWILRPGFESEGGFTFTYNDSDRGTNRVTASNIVMPNGLFFTDGVMKERFKLLGKENRPVKNARTGEETPTDFVRIEDQKPNKKGKIYEIQAQFREDLANNFRNYDRTAVLRLDAVGQGGSEFEVEENTTFALPPDSPKKDYLLKTVTPESIEVEYSDADGAKKSIVIPKG